MPTHLYYSPAAEGKTAYAVQLARNTAESLTAEVRVCVPTNLQANAFRERLAKAGGAIGVHIQTFDELVSTCLDLAGEAYTRLSEPVQYRLLRAVVDRQPLKHFASLKAKPGFIQLLQEIIAELKFAQIDPADFQNTAEALGNEPRLTELALIYDQYQAQLQVQGWADGAGLYWLAAETLENPETKAGRDWSLLIVDGFDDFTPIQLVLLGQLSGRAAKTVILVTKAETAEYPRFEQTLRKIEDGLGLRSERLPAVEGENGRQSSLVALAGNLFSPAADIVPEAEQAVILQEAADRTAEVRAALRWLKERLVVDGYRPNEVALLARNTEPYRSFIPQIAAEFGLPVRFVDGVPLAQNPMIAALLNLLRLNLPAAPDNKPELARRMVVSAWRCPYFRFDFLSPGDPETLDNIARQQRVIRGLGQWQAAFEAQFQAVERRESDEEEPVAHLPGGLAVRELQDKFNRFLALIRPPRRTGTMRDFVGWLERLVGPDPDLIRDHAASADSLSITFQVKQNEATKTADIAALQTLKDILRGFVWAEDALGQNKPVDYVYFFNELNGAINAAFYRPPTEAGQANILVADVIRVRGLLFKAVAIMGLSEGEFPAVIAEDPFLRDLDRAAMKQDFGFRLDSSTQSAEREFFYEAVARPSEKLLLTRPVLADNGAPWPPSPFWEAVHRLIGSPELPQPTSSESLIAVESAASWPEYWQSLAAMNILEGAAGDGESLFWAKNGGRFGKPVISPAEPSRVDLQNRPTEEVISQAETWLRIRRAADIIQRREQAAESDFDGFLPQLTAHLGSDYGPEHTWSASRLETYQRCGYFFFVQNVLYLQPRPEPAEGMDVTQMGSVYHRLFEAVYKAGLPESLKEDELGEFVRKVANPILDEAPRKEGFRETPWWSQTRQEMIDDVVTSIMVLETGDFAFFQSEAAFGFDELDELVINTAAGRLRLRGFIDRVDRNERGQLRIIDYKLGGPGQFSKRAFLEGKKLQLPLYARAAQETLGLGTVVEGFYWHFRQGKPSYFTLSKADGGVEGAIETAVDHAAEGVLNIRNGRFSPKPPDGGCPSYCPAATFCWHYSPAAYL